MKQFITILFIVSIFTVPVSANVKLKCPEDINLGCNPRKIPSPKPNQLDYQTDCKKAEVVHVEDIIKKDGCTVVLERIYKATDKCGDMDRCVQTITWTEDLIGPVIKGCGIEIVLPCNAEANGLLPSSDPSLLKVSDNCGIREVVLLREDRNSNGCRVKLVRRYRATDECGNRNNCTITYTWATDDVPPVIVRCAPNLNLGCNPSPNLLSPQNGIDRMIVRDNCGKPSIEIGESSESVEGCTVTLTQTYLVVDDCGNKTVCSRTITFTRDTQAPIITKCPADLTLDCPGPEGIVIPEPDFENLEYTDNCGDAAVSVLPGIDIVIVNCKALYSRGYLVTDKCGNTAICQQNITWAFDHTPPTIVCLDLNLGCNPTSIPEPDPSSIIVTDNCCIDGVRHVSDSDIVAEGCKRSMLRRYIARDCCGNESVCNQAITWIYDVTPPIITSCPKDIDLGCNPSPNVLVANGINDVKAEDACGEVTIEFGGVETFVDHCMTTNVYTYIAKDRCGNTATCSRKVTFTRDTQAPIITKCPADLTLDCPGPEGIVIPEPDFENLEYTDNCGDAAVSVLPGIDIVIVNCKALYSRGYLVTDKCGNTAICQQNITWAFDHTPPTIVCLDLNLGCNPTSIPEPDPSSIIVTDNCCIDGVRHVSDSDIVAEGCKRSMLRRYIARDCCGNESVCNQAITWTVDTEAPIIKNCEGAINIGCEQISETALIARLIGYFEVSDNCGGVKIEYVGSEINVQNCERIVSYKFLFTDDCGNTSTCVKKVIFSTASKAPVIVKCPESKYLGCLQGNFEVPPPTPDDVVVDSDCDYTVTVLNGIDIVVFGCTATYSRAYIVTNDCGFADTCSQVFTWTSDVINPVIKKCPEGKNFGCVREQPKIPILTKADVAAEDNCGIEAIEITSTTNVIDCKHTFTYHIVVKDKCGNEATCDVVYMWILIEKELRDVPFPDDVTVFCGKVPEVPTFESSGACGILVPIFVGDVANDDCGDGNCTVFRTWKKVDCFGNETIHVQVIKLTCQITSGVLQNDKNESRKVSLRDNQSDELNLSLYPNPGNDRFTLDWNGHSGQLYTLTMIDVTGRLVMKKILNSEEGNNSQMIDAGAFEDGIYIIQLTSERSKKVAKWIKTH